MVVWLAVGLASSSAAVPAGNLLQNPGGEAGLGSTGPNCGSGVTVPGWTGTSGFTAVQYGTGSYPSQPVSDAIGGGSNFLTGGCTSGADAGQTIDVSPYAADIDAGHIRVTLSADLGGYLTQEDDAQVTVSFEAGDSNFGHVTVGPVSAADRGDQTTLLARQTQSIIPAG